MPRFARLTLLTLAVALAGTPVAVAARRWPAPVTAALDAAQSDRAQAITLLEAAIAQTRGDTSVLGLHLAEQHRLAGDRSAAAAGFRAVLGAAKDASTRDAARLGLALLDADAGLDSQTAAIIASVKESDALDTQNADRFVALATQQALADGALVASYTRKALEYSKSDAQLHQRVVALFEALAAAPAEAATRAAEAEAAAQVTSLDNARAALRRGDRETARRMATELVQRLAGTPEAALAQGVLDRVDAAPIDPTAIAVLLPASGRFETAGRQMRLAFEDGWTAEGGDRRLIFIDSGGTADTAVAALRQAVLVQGVLGVVGPLLTDETEPVVRAAEALEVPLVTLSQAYDARATDLWTFKTMVTLRDQVAALVEFAHTERGMDAFAIFAPDSSYGQRAADAFEAEARARGLAIVDRATYAEKGTVLTGAAAGLARPGVIDFDAIFVPDAASHLPIVVSALAYVDLPVGEYAAMRTERVPLLGLSAWHVDTLPAAGGVYTRGALITDGWAPPAVDDAARGPRAFVERYRATHDRTPTALEALVSDAGRLVAAASKQAPTTREAFRTAILSASIAESATGTRGFDLTTRDAVAGVRILSVGANSFTSLATVDPRPAAP